MADVVTQKLTLPRAVRNAYSCNNAVKS